MILTPITVFSSTISEANENDSIQRFYQIEANDIKYANLIFAEHSKLLKENKLLWQQIDNYNEYKTITSKIDSIQDNQIKNLSNLNLDYSNKIINLDNSLQQKDKSLKAWKIGGISVSVCLLVLLLLK